MRKQRMRCGFIIKMSFGCLSYRNGKYQGCVNAGMRQGVGVLVDDDLTFHLSHWQENRMQGPTLLYLAHAKYIYGEWKNNEPHGLNVYRSGDTVILAKYQFGVPTGRCLLVLERVGFACVLLEEGKEWVVMRAGAIGSHSALMRMVELLGVDVPEHYLSLIKFACSFSTHSPLRTFPCHRTHCYFGYVNGLGIVFNSNNGLVTVGQHKNEELCEFGGRFFARKVGEEGNFAPNGQTVQYKGERPTQKIYSIYQRLHRRDSNFVNEPYESKTKIFASIQSLIINKLKNIVQEARKSDNIPRFDLNESIQYRQCDEEQGLRLVEMRDKIYSPPKKVFQKQSLSRTSSKPELPHSTTHSLVKKSAMKVSTAIKEQKVGKIVTPIKTQKSRVFCESSKAESTETKFSQNKRTRQRHQNSDLYNRINQLRTSSGKPNDCDKQPQEFLPVDSHLLKEFTQTRQEEDCNNLQETSTFKRIIEEEEETEEIKRNLEDLIENTPKKRSSYKKREKSVEQLSRPTYQDIDERRKRIIREFQELNSSPNPNRKLNPNPNPNPSPNPNPNSNPTSNCIANPNLIPNPNPTPNHLNKQPIKSIESPCQSHQISLEHEEQNSFGYMPLSISNRLNQKRETSRLKQERPLAIQGKSTLLEKSQKITLQENTQEEKTRDHSSTRRAHYNYGAKDSRTQPHNQNQEPVDAPPSTVSPARQKLTYQYMFE